MENSSEAPSVLQSKQLSELQGSWASLSVSNKFKIEDHAVMPEEGGAGDCLLTWNEKEGRFCIHNFSATYTVEVNNGWMSVIIKKDFLFGNEGKEYLFRKVKARARRIGDVVSHEDLETSGMVVTSIEGEIIGVKYYNKKEELVEQKFGANELRFHYSTSEDNPPHLYCKGGIGFEKPTGRTSGYLRLSAY